MIRVVRGDENLAVNLRNIVEDLCGGLVLTIEKSNLVVHQPSDCRGQLGMRFEVSTQAQESPHINHTRLKPFLIVVLNPPYWDSAVEVLNIKNWIQVELKSSLFSRVVQHKIPGSFLNPNVDIRDLL
jgi:hypothetical protein